MSKLRADITYGHRLHNHSISVEPTSDIDNINEIDTNQNPNNLNNAGDNNGQAAILEGDTGEDSDDETVEPQLQNDFGKYLYGWAEMLEEKKNAELDEEKSDMSLDDVTHPANDTNAKWDLVTLFKKNENINLPF